MINGVFQRVTTPPDYFLFWIGGLTSMYIYVLIIFFIVFRDMVGQILSGQSSLQDRNEFKGAILCLYFK